MSADIIVEKYANAMFETSFAASTLSKVAAELDVVTKAFSDQNVVDFFKNPFNSKENKMMVAKATLEGKVSAEIFNFIITLVQNERIQLIAKISEAFQEKSSQSGGEAEGVLFAAQEPTAEFKAKLEAKVSEVLKKKVHLKVQTDKSLIAGFKVQVGGWILDDSAQNHLKKLTEDISKRGL
ncbi:MAG: ATP synthase F1 subunit delta [Bdellovibrio sp.]|nr:ATP synthase F1 subunit delta [Bdellovibrio sp.]